MNYNFFHLTLTFFIGLGIMLKSIAMDREPITPNVELLSQIAPLRKEIDLQPHQDSLLTQYPIVRGLLNTRTYLDRLKELTREECQYILSVFQDQEAIKLIRETRPSQKRLHEHVSYIYHTFEYILGSQSHLKTLQLFQESVPDSLASQRPRLLCDFCWDMMNIDSKDYRGRYLQLAKRLFGHAKSEPQIVLHIWWSFHCLSGLTLANGLNDNFIRGVESVLTDDPITWTTARAIDQLSLEHTRSKISYVTVH